MIGTIISTKDYVGADESYLGTFESVVTGEAP